MPPVLRWCRQTAMAENPFYDKIKHICKPPVSQQHIQQHTGAANLPETIALFSADTVLSCTLLRIFILITSFIIVPRTLPLTGIFHPCRAILLRLSFLCFPDALQALMLPTRLHRRIYPQADLPFLQALCLFQMRPH